MSRPSYRWRWIGVLIILIASVLPWAVLPTDLTGTGFLQGLPLLSRMAVGSGYIGPPGQMTAWRGSFIFGFYALPKWIVVLVALGLPFLGQSWIVGAIAGLAIAHLTLFALAIAALGGWAALGSGYWITLAVYGLLLAEPVCAQVPLR
ncbi:hypothetical protein C7271_11290 [filamentous cyanobacterium CCP5]|nr:hypothetical protein C7271_11290 [filamentous cyanobacterium CCP5]